MEHKLESMRKVVYDNFTDDPRSAWGNTRPIVIALWEWVQDCEDAQEVIDLLESCNCAGCNAPDGLIYNNEIAAKFPDWWDDIDNALYEWRENTGEGFTPETTGQLVWFAVEYYAYEIASFLQSHNDYDEWIAQDNDPSEDDFLDDWETNIKPMIVAEYGADDEPAINEGFCNWVDAEQKDGRISEHFAYYITQEGLVS